MRPPSLHPAAFPSVQRHPLSISTDSPSAAGWNWQQRLFRRELAAEAVAAETVLSQVRTPRHARVEAALFVAEGPLALRKLTQLATLADVREARRLIEELNEMYDAGGSAFRIERVATGYKMYTLPQFAWWLDQLHHRQSALKLSPPAMETLTIVAFRQPVIRADIEQIRGVQCTEMLKLLMDRGLVRIGGEDTSLGRPYLYETTRLFLELFGLRSLDDLPMADELRRRPEQPVEETEEDQESAGDEAAAGETDADGPAAEDETAESTAADSGGSADRAAA
ncbi:MAG: SMC-Scp complex subunit ScpB [Planctomycetaceae bacterium]|nr:SMC-Scp complex subunit ScpB [Planctomycetaceae bacterium]